MPLLHLLRHQLRNMSISVDTTNETTSNKSAMIENLAKSQRKSNQCAMHPSMAMNQRKSNQGAIHKNMAMS
jgi:hypothetical protein